MLEDPSWYVLLTRIRYESTVYEGLQKKNIESFLPTVQRRSRRKDRKFFLSRPLFPGYLFVRTSLVPEKHIFVLKTIGAVCLLGGNNGPVPVPDEAIHSLRIMISNSDRGRITIGKNLHKGDTVIVAHGPFSGVQGCFDRYRGKSRVVVHIDALGQFAAVEVDEMDVERI
jgi:transcription antitermination factor NusG